MSKFFLAMLFHFKLIFRLIHRALSCSLTFCYIRPLLTGYLLWMCLFFFSLSSVFLRRRSFSTFNKSKFTRLFRVSLKQFSKKLLSVRPCLRTISCTNIGMNFVPILSKHFKGFLESIVLLVSPSTLCTFILILVSRCLIITLIIHFHIILNWLIWLVLFLLLICQFFLYAHLNKN